MKTSLGAIVFGLVLGAVVSGGLTASYLGSVRNEDSNYGVRLSERCLPEDGIVLKFDYTGNGTALITVLPPEPVATAPAKKEKKQ